MIIAPEILPKNVEKPTENLEKTMKNVGKTRKKLEKPRNSHYYCLILANYSYPRFFVVLVEVGGRKVPRGVSRPLLFVLKRLAYKNAFSPKMVRTII